jgi:SAM-dependent methyltransferase
MVLNTTSTAPSDEVIWHELECGSYRADLELWSALAATQPGPVLDIGAGSGRVSLHLANAGHRVIALDSSPELLAWLSRRAGDLELETICADARSFELPQPGSVGLCVLPMQTLQLLGGAHGRAAFLKRARASLRPGGLLACAVVCELEPFDCADGHSGPSPERAQIGDLLYVSHARRVALTGETIVLERERRILSLDGQARGGDAERNIVQLDRVSPTQLWREARAAGLNPEPSHVVQATAEHTASTVVMLRV